MYIAAAAIWVLSIKPEKNTIIKIKLLNKNHETIRECVRAGAAGAQTRRSLGYHLLHPLILKLLVLCAPADFETQSSLL